jgi:hypothetical protein
MFHAITFIDFAFSITGGFKNGIDKNCTKSSTQ